MSIVSLPLPQQLVNGNVADGGQVMADLNAIASNVNANAAKNGVNSDITSLTALTSITSTLTITGWSINNSTLTTPTIIGGLIDSTTIGVTQPSGTNNTTLSTTEFATRLAFNAALPVQPGGTQPYILRSLGGVASWILNGLILSTRTSNTILTVADVGTLIDITSGTFTQTFSPAASLLSGWWCWIRNGTGDVTLDPNGSELIDGLTSFVMYPQEVRLVQCDGTKFTSFVVHSFYRKAITSFSFVMPPGYKQLFVDLVGAGGGGGSGARGAAAQNRSGGGPGGAAGRMQKTLSNIVAGTTTTITVGAGGTGGAVNTVDSGTGINGVAGGNTTFGTLLTAFGGNVGQGGSAGGTTIGPSTGGSSGLSTGTSVLIGSALGGRPSTVGGLPATPSNVGWGGGGSLATAADGGNTEWGGAGSGTSGINATTVNGNGGSSLFGVPAGTSGGWITSANTTPATAAPAGIINSYTAGGGALGGTCGASPTVGGSGVPAATDDVVGTSGAGGGSSSAVAAAAGGNGAAPGGAGGGGGASLNGNNSGAGGNGADGRAIIQGVV